MIGTHFSLLFIVLQDDYVLLDVLAGGFYWRRNTMDSLGYSVGYLLGAGCRYVHAPGERVT
jgi:hypothetical protein